MRKQTQKQEEIAQEETKQTKVKWRLITSSFPLFPPVPFLVPALAARLSQDLAQSAQGACIYHSQSTFALAEARGK